MKPQQIKLKQLEANYETAKAQARIARDKYESEKLKTELPEIKKKYEGKFWKYKNQSGDESWWLYSYCRKVLDENSGIFDSFELIKSERNRYIFQSSAGEFYYLCEKQITRKEYLKALKIFKNNLNKLTEV